jgi:autotransporter-associated beta strand protein
MTMRIRQRRCEAIVRLIQAHKIAPKRRNDFMQIDFEGMQPMKPPMKTPFSLIPQTVPVRQAQPMGNLIDGEPRVKRHQSIPRFDLFTASVTSLVLASFISLNASATLCSWKGYGGSQDISDGGNWYQNSGGYYNPNPGDDIQFNNTGSGSDCGATGNKRAYDNYGSSYFGNIIAYSCSGGMEWAGNQTACYKFENQDTLSFTATANLQNRTGPDNDLQINPVNGPVYVGNVIIYNNKWLYIYGANTLTVNGVISQSGGTSSMVAGANGATTVILKSANTFSGTTYVNNGTLQASISGTLGSSAVTLGDSGGSAGAALNLDGGLTWDGQTTTVRSGSSGTKTIANTSGTSGTATYNNSLTLNDNATLYANSSGAVTLSGSTLDLQSHTLMVDGSGNSTISGTLQNSSGSGKLVKNGSGTTTLSNTGNSYTGGTTINAGTLSISSDSNLGAVPGSLNTSSITFGAASGQGLNTVLSITADTTLNATRGITIGANGAKLDAGSHTLTISGPIVDGSGNNHLFILAAGNTTLAGNLSGTGDIVKQGSGTLTLNGANNTFGTTTANFYLDNGNVYGANNNAFGSTSGGNGAVTLGADASGNNGATTLLLTSGGISVANPINVRYYSGFNASKTIGGNNTSGTATFTGNLTLNDSVSLTAASSGTVAFNGVIQTGSAGGSPSQSVNGTPGITIVGGGTVSLGNANTYSGPTTVSAGELHVGVNNALPTGTTVTVGGSGTAGTLCLGGNNQQLASIATAGTASSQIIGNDSTSSDSQLTLTGNSTFGGIIKDVIGSGTKKVSLVFNGSGNTLTLSGANTYTGNTTISAGTLALSGSGSIANSPNITVSSGGTFDVSGLTTALTLGSGQTLKASATGANTTGTLTMGSSKGLTLSAGGLAFTAYGGGSTAPLTVASAGSLALNSASVTVTTTTALAAGTYKLIAKSGSATVTGTPGTLTVNGSGVVSGATATLQVVSGELWLYVPGVSSSGTLSAFTTTYGTASTAQSGITVSGTGLSGNLTATAPTGFQVSSDNSTYGTTATFTPSGGSASGTLYVRLAATAAVSGNYNSQNITLTSSGASTVNITTSSSGNTVSPKALSITTPTIASKPYDGAVTAGAVTVGTLSGFVGSETVTATATAVNYSSANVGTYNNVTVTYTLHNGSNGGLAANYSLASGTATGQITANATLTLSVNTNAAADLLKAKVFIAAGLDLGSAVLDSASGATLGSLSTSSTKITYTAGGTAGSDNFNCVVHDSNNVSKDVQVDVTVNNPSASTYSGNLTIRQMDSNTVRVIISGTANVQYKLQHTTSLSGNPTWTDLETFTMPSTGVTNYDLGISYGTEYYRTVLP